MKIILALVLGCCVAFSVVEKLPHDASCYTQGLEITEGRVVESCGQYGQSRIVLSHFKDNKTVVDKSIRLSDTVFGEGMTFFNGKYYVLTWRENKVFIYNQNMELEKQLNWPRQGWGLTNNGTHLFLSDGTSYIFVLDQNLKRLKVISVTENGKPVIYLNELQFYKGKILSNVYMQNKIVLIDPETGNVQKSYDLKSLHDSEVKQHMLNRDEVLNGIAYDSAADKLYFTGKKWKFIYQIKL